MSEYHFCFVVEYGGVLHTVSRESGRKWKHEPSDGNTIDTVNVSYVSATAQSLAIVSALKPHVETIGQLLGHNDDVYMQQEFFKKTQQDSLLIHHGEEELPKTGRIIVRPGASCVRYGCLFVFVC